MRSKYFWRLEYFFKIINIDIKASFNENWFFHSFNWYMNFSMIKINKYRIEYLQYKYIVYEYLIDKKKLYLKMNYYL